MPVPRPSAAAVEEALRVLAAAPPEAFDGHTEFQRMAPAQRLAWMEGALALIESRRGPRTDGGRTADGGTRK